MKITKAQRQVRYLPVFLALVVAIIYGLLDLVGLEPAHREIFNGPDYSSLSRYLDIVVFYLGTVILVIQIQTAREEGEDEVLFELYLVMYLSIAFSAIAHFAFSTPFWLTAAIITGLSLAYFKSWRAATVELIFFFLSVTLINGFIDSLLLSMIVFIFAVVSRGVKHLLHEKINKLGVLIGVGYEDLFLADAEKKEDEDGGEEEVEDETDFASSWDNEFVLRAPAKKIAGYDIEQHVKWTNNDYSPISYQLYYAPKQVQGKTRGTEIIKNPILAQAFNANLLDWFLKYPVKIPEEFKPIRVCFWGTIYTRNSVRYIRYLYFEDGQFKDSFMAVDRIFNYKEPALIAVNKTD